MSQGCPIFRGFTVLVILPPSQENTGEEEQAILPEYQEGSNSSHSEWLQYRVIHIKTVCLCVCLSVCPQPQQQAPPLPPPSAVSMASPVSAPATSPPTTGPRSVVVAASRYMPVSLVHTSHYWTKVSGGSC